eukprot:2574622-Rhodomonas_salina.1
MFGMWLYIACATLWLIAKENGQLEEMGYWKDEHDRYWTFSRGPHHAPPALLGQPPQPPSRKRKDESGESAAFDTVEEGIGRTKLPSRLQHDGSCAAVCDVTVGADTLESVKEREQENGEERGLGHGGGRGPREVTECVACKPKRRRSASHPRSSNTEYDCGP